MPRRSLADPRDLTDLASIKNFLVPVNQTTSSDLILSQFITGISIAIEGFLARKLVATSYTELRNGNNRTSIRTRHWPIIAVSGVAVDGITVQSASGPVGPGFVNDQHYIYLRNGFTGGGGYGGNGRFGWSCGWGGSGVNYGIKNVSLTYSAGFITPGQIAVGNLPVWGGNTITPVGMQILPGNGFFYYALTAGTTGGSSPAFPVVEGQTVNDNGVVWLNQGAYEAPPSGALPLPQDIQMGVLEQTAYHFVSRARIGVTSVGEGPQRTGLLVRDWLPNAKALLLHHKSVVTIGDWS